MVDAQLSTYNIPQLFHPFEVDPGWPETWAMEKKCGPRSDEPCTKIWEIHSETEKKQKCVFHPSNSTKRRQLEKALMPEKAEILSMLEDAGIYYISLCFMTVS